MKISEIIDKYRPPKVLIFGRFGTGKTAYVLTHGPGTYVLDFDGGLRTAMTLKDQYTDHRLSCEVFDCVEKDFRYPSAFERGKAKILSIANTVRGGKTWEYDILVIDSFTEFADAAIRSVTGASGHAGKNPSQPEWGLILNEIENVLTILKSLPIIVVMTAHEGYYDLGESSVLRIVCPGRKLPDKVGGYFDEVIRSRVKDAPQDRKRYVIETVGSDAVLARSRSLTDKEIDMDKGIDDLFKKLSYTLPDRACDPVKEAPEASSTPSSPIVKG